MLRFDDVAPAEQRPSTEIWFRAKRYGWGWGAPVAWQGWVVLVGWLALLLAGVLALVRLSPVVAFVYTLAMVALLIAICWIKGERPRWHWGGHD